MNQIILEHYKIPSYFISFFNFSIPFIIEDKNYNEKDEISFRLDKSKQKILYKKGYEGIYINREEGYWIYWYENGQKESEGNYKDGKKDGFWIYWYENGQKDLEGNYKNGKKDGFWISWYENGKLNEMKESEGIWEYGKQDGFWVFWDKDNKKELEEYWENGKKRKNFYLLE